jgi:hypothetical protein
MADLKMIYGAQPPRYEELGDGAEDALELDCLDMQKRFAFMQSRVADTAAQNAGLVEKVSDLCVCVCVCVDMNERICMFLYVVLNLEMRCLCVSVCM